MIKKRRGGQAKKKSIAAGTFNTATVQTGYTGTAYAPLVGGQANAAYQKSKFAIDNADINVKYGILQYIRQDTDVSGHSPSQNMNHKLETGGQLTVNEKRMIKNLDRGMTPIGTNTVLYRADHAQDIMSKIGVKGWENMTQAQLTQAVVGKVVTENKYLSTSINTTSNPFISGAQSGGRSAMITFKTPGTIKAVIGNPKQGESIVQRGTQWRINGARFTGRIVYPRQGGSYPEIAFDAEFI